MDRGPLQEALERAEELCSQVNEGVREKENSDRLEWIQAHVQCEGVTEVHTHTSRSCASHTHKQVLSPSHTRTQAGPLPHTHKVAYSLSHRRKLSLLCVCRTWCLTP